MKFTSFQLQEKASWRWIFKVSLISIIMHFCEILFFCSTMMAKPKEFAHLIKNKFGSADNINQISKLTVKDYWCRLVCLLSVWLSFDLIHFWLLSLLLTTNFLLPDSFIFKRIFFSNISTAFNKGEILVLQKGIHDTGSFIKKIFSSGIISVQSYY